MLLSLLIACQPRPNSVSTAEGQDTAATLQAAVAPHLNQAVILAELLSVGVSVLLTDVDVVLTQDPFPALYRDTDVEGMTDGWDDDSAYGHLHELPLERTAPRST